MPASGLNSDFLEERWSAGDVRPTRPIREDWVLRQAGFTVDFGKGVREVHGSEFGMHSACPILPGTERQSHVFESEPRR